MRANKSSALDKKIEKLKNKKEKEKIEEEEEEDDDDEEDEEEEDDEELDSQEKTKNTRQQMTKNKDIKSTVDNKIKVQPKVPTGVYKSKAISSQKQDINKPKETKETTTTTTGSSIRRALLEKRAIQTNNQTTAQNQNKINPIPSKIQVQTKQPIQAQTQSKYIKRVVESKEPIITKNENSKEIKDKNLINQDINNKNNTFSSNTSNNKDINNNENQNKERKQEEIKERYKKVKRTDVDKEEIKNEEKEKEIENININNEFKKNNDLLEENNEDETQFKIELPEAKKNYVGEDVMRKNGIEIVKISLEQQNKLREKKAESAEKKKKKEDEKNFKKYKKNNINEHNIYHKKIPVQKQFKRNITSNYNNNRDYFYDNRNDLNKTTIGFYNDYSRKHNNNIKNKYYPKYKYSNNYDEFNSFDDDFDSFEDNVNNYSFTTYNYFNNMDRYNDIYDNNSFRGQKTIFIERGKPNMIYRRRGFRGRRGYH